MMMYDELRGNLMAHATHFSVHDETSLLLLKAADAIEDLQGKAKVLEKLADHWCNKAPKWIPVTERLPEDGVFVLVSNDDGIIMVAKYETDLLGWYKRYCPYDHDFWWENEDGRITHWMPLPQPPESGEA